LDAARGTGVSAAPLVDGPAWMSSMAIVSDEFCEWRRQMVSV
jgi:hypothetical protein